MCFISLFKFDFLSDIELLFLKMAKFSGRVELVVYNNLSYKMGHDFLERQYKPYLGAINPVFSRSQYLRRELR